MLPYIKEVNKSENYVKDTRIKKDSIHAFRDSIHVIRDSVHVFRDSIDCSFEFNL